MADNLQPQQTDMEQSDTETEDFDPEEASDLMEMAENARVLAELHVHASKLLGNTEMSSEDKEEEFEELLKKAEDQAVLLQESLEAMMQKAEKFREFLKKAQDQTALLRETWGAMKDHDIRELQEELSSLQKALEDASWRRRAKAACEGAASRQT